MQIIRCHWATIKSSVHKEDSPVSEKLHLFLWVFHSSNTGDSFLKNTNKHPDIILKIYIYLSDVCRSCSDGNDCIKNVIIYKTTTVRAAVVEKLVSFWIIRIENLIPVSVIFTDRMKGSPKETKQWWRIHNDARRSHFQGYVQYMDTSDWLQLR